MAIVLSVVAPALGQINVLDNPGFESGDLIPWFDSAGGGPEPWNVTSADAHSGSFSATCVGNRAVGQVFAPLPTSEILEVSFWLEQPAAPLSFEGDNVEFFYLGAGSESISIRPSGPDWEFFDVTDALDAGEALVALRIWGYYCGDCIEENRTYVDDVSVLLIPEPTAFSLLAFGTLVLVGRRARPCAP